MIYQQNDCYILRHVGNELFLVPTGLNSYNFHGLVVLNEVSALIWEHLSTPASANDLVQIILNQYDADKSQVENDVDELLKIFLKQGLIIRI